MVIFNRVLQDLLIAFLAMGMIFSGAFVRLASGSEVPNFFDSFEEEVKVAVPKPPPKHDWDSAAAVLITTELHPPVKVDRNLPLRQ